MKRVLQSALAVAALALAVTAARAEVWDVLIRGATVVDGTGRPGFAADVAVKDGRIAFVGEAGHAKAKNVIDARGFVLAPGFIDVHNHVPDSLIEPVDYTNSAYLTQGVTTIVGGPDGYLSPSEIRQALAVFEKNGLGTNYAFYIGHNGVRREVMGGVQRAPIAAELERMKALVREGMEMGAVGLSTGLMYEPGMFSRTDEVIALAKEVSPYDGTYDSHTRNPVHEMLASEAEAIEIGTAAGIPAKLGHLKAVGLTNKGRIGDVIALVEAAHAQGHVVVADQYPYDGAATALLEEVIILPHRTENPDRPDIAAVRQALDDTDGLPAIKEATEHGVQGGFSWVKAVGYGSMRIVDASGSEYLVGRNIELLAKERGQEPFDLIVSLIRGAERPIMVTLGAIDEADVQELLVQPWSMIASDGGYVGPQGEAAFSHPRSTGTFTRVLGHYARDVGLLSLPEAVRKMTSLPAAHLRLYDRGRIKVGHAADIVIFDPATVRDRSTWVDPHAFSEGIVHVLVNGVSTLREGKATGARPGMFVKRQSGPLAGQQ